MTNDERLSAFNNNLPVTSLQCFLNVFCPKDFIIIDLNSDVDSDVNSDGLRCGIVLIECHCCDWKITLGKLDFVSNIISC